MSYLTVFIVNILYSVGCILCISDDGNFYPFGIENGDRVLQKNDDKSSGSIPTSISIPFFAKSFTEIYVNNNGGVSFGGDIRSYTPEAFPLEDSYTFIAVYWSDVDTRYDDHGAVYYRESTDPALLQRISDQVGRVYGDRGLAFFSAEWAFIATWSNVTYFSGQKYIDFIYLNKGETNTYQMAVVTDGTYSFTIFNYGDLMWTTGLASDGRVPAQVGFNAGDSIHYFVVPDSRTSDIINIQHSSNVGSPGTWIFRVDQATINADTCIGTQSELTPAMEECPKLSDPHLVDGLYVYFYCDITHQYTKKDPVSFEVEFLFDNVRDEKVPVFLLKGAETRANLHEKYLHGNLGKQVSCQVVSYYDITPDIKSSPAQSNSYFAGIKASSYSVRVYEGVDTPTPVHLKSTLPISCFTTLPGGGGLSGCQVNFNIQSSDNLVVYQPGKYTEEAFTCQYRLDDSDWKPSEGRAYSQAHPLYVFPTLSLTPDPPSLEQIEFQSVSYIDKRDETGQKYTFMWNDYTPPPISVYRYESIEVGATCYATGDPRMTTFDGLFYSIYADGQFVLAKTEDNRQFEVHVRFEHCRDGQALSCVCGLAVREGNDTILLDMCHGKLLQKGHMTASTNRKTSHGMTLSCNELGRDFTIQTPSGAFANLHLTAWGMNVDVHIPGKDFNKTTGLCGTYDSSLDKELQAQVTRLFIDPHDPQQLDTFVQSWRISPGESLFEKPPSPVYPDPSTVTQYCQCTDYALDELVPCSEQTTRVTDPVTYPEVTHFTVTLPTSELAGSFLTAVGRKKRKSFGTNHNDEDLNYEYDASDFEYAVDSVNVKLTDWPTESGITREKAEGFCGEGIRQSAIYTACRGEVGEQYVTELVNKCVADVQVSSSLSPWAEDKLGEMLSECKLSVLQSNRSVSENGSSDSETGRRQAVDSLHSLLTHICPNQCTGNGVCTHSTCTCHSGYEGNDCSVLTSSPPDVLSFSNSGLCDRSTQPCTRVLVAADNLIHTHTLSCQVQDKETGDHNVTLAQFEGLGLVHCGLPVHIHNMHTYRVSVSRDGVHYGSPGTLVVYMSDCITCDLQDCVVQTGMCSIEGTCYHSDDLHTDDPCLVCRPHLNSTAWSKSRAGACIRETSEPRPNHTLAVCLGVLVPLLLLAALSLPVIWYLRTRARKDKEKRASSYLYQNQEKQHPTILTGPEKKYVHTHRSPAAASKPTPCSLQSSRNQAQGLPASSSKPVQKYEDPDSFQVWSPHMLRMGQKVKDTCMTPVDVVTDGNNTQLSYSRQHQAFPSTDLVKANL